MHSYWQRVLDILKVVSIESVNTENIKIVLASGIVDYDMTILDTLYFYKVINYEEYLEYAKKLKARMEQKMKYLEDAIKEAEINKESFDPMCNYCCAFNSNDLVDFVS